MLVLAFRKNEKLIISGHLDLKKHSISRKSVMVPAINSILGISRTAA